MAKIYAPNQAYTGVSATVAFANGVGETNDPKLIAWFYAHGYTVKDQVATCKQKEKPDKQR